MKLQRKQLVLYITLTIGVLLVCLAVGYAGHKRTIPQTANNYDENKPSSQQTSLHYAEHKPNPSHQPTDNTPTDQPLMVLTEDGTLLLYYDPQVKAIYTRWQAIRQFTWQKDYRVFCQPRYLYRKGHYIYASSLAIFNGLLLPLLWGYLSFTFWGEPVTIFGLPTMPATWEITILRSVLHFVIIYGCLYRPVYWLVERFIGERLLIEGKDHKEIEDLLADTQALLAEEGNLPPLDEAAIEKMGKFYNDLLALHVAYYEAISAEASVPRQSESKEALKEALQKHEKEWIAKYAPYIESELLESISEDLEAQMQLLTDIAPN